MSPLADERFRNLVSSLREWASRPVPLCRPDPLCIAAFVQDRARRISARLTRTLLSEEDRQALRRLLVSCAKVRLTVRLRSDDDLVGDAALALPWELLAPEGPGRFPARDSRLVVIREAPASATSGHEDSGLCFFAAPYPSKPGLARPFETEPVTAAALHRKRFAQVVGYFGPDHEELNRRLEEGFHSALAAGGGLLETAAAARAALNGPVGHKGAGEHFPFAWSQLAVYQRG